MPAIERIQAKAASDEVVDRVVWAMHVQENITF